MSALPPPMMSNISSAVALGYKSKANTHNYNSVAREPSDFERFQEEMKTDSKAVCFRGAPPPLASELFVLRRVSSKKSISEKVQGLEYLSNTINTKQTGIIKQAIVGNGGVGKSWLANRYFILAREKSNKQQVAYNLTIWANVTTLLEILYELARWTGYVVAENTTPKVWTSEVYRRLLDISQIKILLVIDDVEAPLQLINESGRVLVEDLLPSNEMGNSTSLLHVIITSRWCEWMHDVERISLGLFDEAEAISCFKKLLPMQVTNDNEENIYSTLAIKVEFLPFALPLVAQYIKLLGSNEDATREFIEQYDNFYKKDLITYDSGKNNKAVITIATLWNITLEKLKQDDKDQAIHTLCYLSYLEGSYINKALLLELLGIEAPPKGIDSDCFYKRKLANYLDPLIAYSLVEGSNAPTLQENKVGDFSSGIRIHSLLQEAVRLPQSASVLLVDIETLLRKFDERLPEDELAMFFGDVSISKAKQDISHILKIIDHAVVFNKDNISSSVNTYLINIMLKVGTYRILIPKSHYVLLYKRLVSILEISSLTMSDKVKLLMVEGFIHYWGDEYEKAEQKLKESLEKQVYLDCKDKLITQIKTKALLAVVYQTNRQHKKAEEFFIDTMKDLFEFSRENPPNERFYLMLLGVYHGLGVAASKQEKYTYAINFLSSILRLWKSFKMIDAPFLGLIYRELGTALMKSGVSEEAEKCFINAIEVQRQLSPAKDLATTYLELAYFRRYQAKFDEAKEYVKKALQLYTTFHDNHYFGIALARCDLARLMLETNHQRQQEYYKNIDIIKELNEAWKSKDSMREEEKAYNLILLCVANYCQNKTEEAALNLEESFKCSFDAKESFLTKDVTRMRSSLKNMSKNIIRKHVVLKILKSTERVPVCSESPISFNLDDNISLQEELSKLYAIFLEMLNEQHLTSSNSYAPKQPANSENTSRIKTLDKSEEELKTIISPEILMTLPYNSKNAFLSERNSQINLSSSEQELEQTTPNVTRIDLRAERLSASLMPALHDILERKRKPKLEFARESLKKEENFSSLLGSQIPKGLALGKASDKGNCFFDALAQILNKINKTDINTVKYLRMLCHDFYSKEKVLVDGWNIKDYGGVDKRKDEYYMVQYTYEECEHHFNGRSPIWGRPNIEGVILCKELQLEGILVIEILKDPETKQPIVSYHLATTTEYKSISEEAAQQYLNNPKIPTLVVNQKNLHFVPLFRNNLAQNNEQQIGREETQDISNSYTFTFSKR